MPEITKEQEAVIDAAKAWWEDDGSDGHSELLLQEAIAALPKPYQSLMPMQLGPEMRVGAAYLRAAAGRLIDEGFSEQSARAIARWACEEEKLAE